MICLFLCGCGIGNTPTKKVEELFTKYQTLDSEVVADLDDVLDMEDYNDTQKEEYKNIMKDHYKSLTYKIKEETIDGNKAVVSVEIEVNDYSSIINDSIVYRNLYMSEFLDETGIYDVSKFINYQLDKLKETEKRIKYTLDITLTKINDKWTIDSLTNTMLDKIHGIYLY